MRKLRLHKQGFPLVPPLPSTRGTVTEANIPELPVGAAVVVDPKTQAVSRALGGPMPVTPTVPCGTCGTPTTMTGTKRCDGCWEVEHRLRDYLRTGGAKARDFVMEVVLELTPAIRPPSGRGIDSDEYAAETVNPMRCDHERRMWDAHHEKCGSCGHIRSQHECHFVGNKPNPCLRCDCKTFAEPTHAQPK